MKGKEIILSTAFFLLLFCQNAFVVSSYTMMKIPEKPTEKREQMKENLMSENVTYRATASENPESPTASTASPKSNEIAQNINNVYFWDECSTSNETSVKDDDMYILVSRATPQPYSCTQKFKVNNGTSVLHLICYSLSFILKCGFEALTVTAGETSEDLCGDQDMKHFTSSYISISYNRRLFGLRGGYTCVLIAKYVFKPQCGIPQDALSSYRIVGGKNAQKNAFPWMAILRIQASGATYLCGGTLISDEKVLTAAHCVDDATEIVVGLGSINKTQLDDTSTWMTSKTFTVHQNFSHSRLINDIAIIQLPRKVKFSNAIIPICLPPAGAETYAGNTSLALGWGALKFNGELPETLQVVELNVWSNAQCNNTWKTVFGVEIHDTEICAYASNKDTCTGDSGGPLIVKVKDAWTLVGITSYGYECATLGVPGVYTRVSKYTSWINSFTPKKETNADSIDETL